MKKNGFTLVEIMVVVIIMGVLTAVGVPKLFGVIAKAKASEVPVAAGTYIHLQNAFLHENNGIGSWKNIGYGAPGGGKTEYFEYRGCIQGKIKLREGGERMVGWQAFNIPKLNYCASYSAWSVILNPLNEHDFNHENLVSSAECGTLTANWEVGEAGVGACEATAALHEIEPEPEPESEPEQSEEPEEEPEEPSSSTEQSTASQDDEDDNDGEDITDCSKFSKSTNSDACSGTAQGWVYVVECGLFAPKGQAKKAKGFTILEKKKDYDKYCTTESSSSSKKSSSSKSNSSNSNANGSNTNGNGTNSGENGTNTGNNGGNTGGGTGGGTTTETPTETEGDGENNGTTEMGGTEQEETPVIIDQYGKPVDYNSLPETLCTERQNKNKCVKGKSVAKANCAKYDTSSEICTQTK